MALVELVALVELIASAYRAWKVAAGRGALGRKALRALIANIVC